MGQIYVESGSGAAIVISDTTNYFEAVTPVWALSPDAVWFDESAGNGRLTYTGDADVMVHVAATISFTTANNNQLTRWRIGKNTTADPAAEAQRQVGTGADVGSTALHYVTSMSTGDYLSLWVRNSTSATNVSLVVANLQAVTMPM